MRNATWFPMLIIGVIGWVFLPAWTPAQDKTPTRPKWEYKIVKIAGTAGHFQAFTNEGHRAIIPGTISEAQLNLLGDQGWDLFKVTDGQRLSNAMTKAEGFSETIYYFKRPK